MISFRSARKNRVHDLRQNEFAKRIPQGLTRNVSKLVNPLSTLTGNFSVCFPLGTCRLQQLTWLMPSDSMETPTPLNQYARTRTHACIHTSLQQLIVFHTILPGIGAQLLCKWINLSWWWLPHVCKTSFPVKVSSVHVLLFTIFCLQYAD